MIGGQLTHVFVPVIPVEIEADTLYVCLPYATAVHRCPGCERKVVTPFAPGSWNLIFDGETVSIHPSIRNGAHDCRSHYFIEGDRFVAAWDRSGRGDLPGRRPARNGGIVRRLGARLESAIRAAFSDDRA
ncbi:MAG TPA: DUF6527 family protein [Candidatus Binatia bacterium]|nr:DUF6527 family protein [Candidatus Binatia bacterium]